MFQNTAKPRGRGRPRSFDESDALKKATQVFWSKGYDGVTIDDLVAWMGVGRPSLYAVFGDKRAIFLRVLKAYAERKGASAAKALLSPQSLRQLLDRGLSEVRRRKCDRERVRPGRLLICVAPLVDDAEVRKFLQNAAAGGAALVEGRFRDAITAGEIPSDFPVAERAIQAHGFCSWPYHACADRHAAQDASQGCRGSGRLGAPVAARKCGRGFLMPRGRDGWGKPFAPPPPSRPLGLGHACAPCCEYQEFCTEISSPHYQ